MEKIKEVILEKMAKIKLFENMESLENHDIPITGNIIAYDSVDMVYLILELQKYYQIKFTAEDLNEYGMSTINKIAQIIQSKLADNNFH